MQGKFTFLFCSLIFSPTRFNVLWRLQELFNLDPPLLVKLAATRWLSFNGAVKTHYDQYGPLTALFNKVVSENDKCPMAETLAALHNDQGNLLMLAFLKPILHQISTTNLLFQNTYADITKVYRDLRTFVFGMANRIVRPEALIQSAKPGMLRVTELEALRNTLTRQDSLKPLDLVGFGDGFRRMAANLQETGVLSRERIQIIKSDCANFLTKLCKELAARLPDSIAEIEKLRFFEPTQVLSTKGRPLFSSLPLDILRE